MGTKYSSQSASGYNSSPPSDDGTASESNKVKWSTFKTKLSDPVKTLSEAVNTALVTALDQSARSVSASDSAAATDHDRVIQVTTASVIITLADAATMGAGYRVRVANQSSGTITAALANSGNTINGVTNTTETIHPKQTALYIVNSATSGYLSEKSIDGGFASVQVFTSTGANTWTKPAGLKRAKVYLKAGGGSGGASSTAFYGGGGGEGEEAWTVIEASALGSTETATVGAGGSAISAGGNDGAVGGTSSFGAHVTVLGGSGGSRGTFGGAGGAGGRSGSGTASYRMPGACGGTGTDTSGAGVSFSVGGGGKGGGTPGLTQSGVANSGGGGSPGNSGANSGAGGSGIIVVEEFF